MLETESDQTLEQTAPEPSPEPAPAKKATKRAPRKTAAKAPAKKTAAKKATAKKTAAKEAAPPEGSDLDAAMATPGSDLSEGIAAPTLLFQAPEPVKAPPRRRAAKKAQPAPEPTEPAESAPTETAPTETVPTEAAPTETAPTETAPTEAAPTETAPTETAPTETAPTETAPAETGPTETAPAEAAEEAEEPAEGARRRRRRGGRRRRKGGQEEGAEADVSEEGAPDAESATGEESAPDETGEGEEGAPSTRRRRRRRRSGEGAEGSPDDPANTVVKVRERRKTSDDEISGVAGSTRLEAKKQRRREGREAGRRRPPIVSEAEFLARRESVERVMVVRQRADLTQIAVLEDKMLVEHYVARESQTSLIGNVYLGRVQNVLPSMEAAFVDIGKGRNAVLYAGEVNWSELGQDGQPRRIETALKSGQQVLVQVTKDAVGHKGARLTSQISLPGRYLVYVPGGQSSGISRKLPDTERNRLKTLLKEVIPEEAGVIIRTAAEGASEDELRRDVARLTARWEDIEKKVEAGQAPALLYGEPDLTVKVVRDLFTEDFSKLVVSGDDAWDTIEGYVGYVAPELMERVERWNGDADVFASYRVDEQIAKGLDRKVFLPSGGSLVLDRTEAMTVVDVNTGKFTGSGGNLEETVTKNNLEAAEEIVRQLRLRDIGGIIVIDFIDMVLESNRDLVLRRLIECLGRDRTRHQVAEVTTLGLVQMTRKRIGTGLLEAFAESCERCGGRGVIVHHEPVEPAKPGRDAEEPRRGRRGRRRGGGGAAGDRRQDDTAKQPATPGPAALPPAASEPARPEPARPEPVVAISEPEPLPAPPVPAPTDQHAPEPVTTEPVTTGRARGRRRAVTRPAGPPQ